MKSKTIVFFISLFIVSLPRLIYAETEITQLFINEHSYITAENGPYTVSAADIYIPLGREIVVEEGTTIRFDGGQIKVSGTLKFQGTSSRQISIELVNPRKLLAPMNIVGGNLYMQFTNATGEGPIIESIGGKVEIVHSHFENIQGSRSYMIVYSGSTISLADNLFSGVNTPHVLDIYNNSHGDIRQTSFQKSGYKAAISIFDGWNSQGKTSMSISASTFLQSPSVGVEVFNGASVILDGVSITDSKASGLLAHSNGGVDIRNSLFERNDIGVESYNSSTTIMNSSIEENKSYGMIAYGGPVTASKNWWGSANGPYNKKTNPAGTGQIVTDDVVFIPWLIEKPNAIICCSSILFIPGIEASRLYVRNWTENQLWEPNTNADVKKLFLDSNGNSIEKNVYTRDVIRKTNLSGGLFDVGVYDGISNFLASLVSQSMIAAWTAAPYDWRGNPDEVANRQIMLEKNATTSLEILFNSLVNNSKTGKVSILTHSNGGLVAKTFIKNLFDKGKGSLVDRLIMVGAPEYGTPQAVGDMLHGDGQSILGGLILSKSTARDLSKNMSAAYSLLPSQKYFGSSSPPVITFTADSDPALSPASKYGNTITDRIQLENFLVASKGDRVDTKSIDQPSVLNSGLLVRSENFHQSMDGLFQSSSLSGLVGVTNIVGVGRNTTTGISYRYTKKGDKTKIDRTRVYSADGDGVVLAGELSIRSGDVYAVDISALNLETKQNYQHSNMMSIPVIQQMIVSILRGELSKLPPFVSKQSMTDDPRKRYEFSVHSPVAIMAYDQDGKRTGLVKEAVEDQIGFVLQEIPNSQYDNFGEAKTIITSTLPAKIVLTGLDTGIFRFTATEFQGDNVISKMEYSNVPTIEGMTAEFIPASSSLMTIDYNADGFKDEELFPDSQSSELDSTTAITLARAVIVSQVQIKHIRDKYIRELDLIQKTIQKGGVEKAYKETVRITRNLATAMKVYNFMQKKIKIKKLVEPIVQDTTILYYQFQRLNTIFSALAESA
ncbi:MAG: right-handed parallel beta-helix repeat-containing protein [Patescibacteria group bacterium]